ncbi:hypothetical protein Q9L58_010497 [Maublancomyces gigas]|uniref:Endonuclease/exonuclease/phosphatase domain-containing protein n=1 Tax=Discina gigas TaxID=1032678 RepID=A0ABR3G3X7_9PEZI
MWNSLTLNPKRHKALITVIDKYEMALLNEPDTYTYNYPTGRGRSVLDLPFATPDIINMVTNWAVAEDMTTGSDHEVIQFHLTSD